jgi:hypothetical protein
MQQIVRRLRPAPRFAPGQRGTLPTYLLFAPGLGADDWAPKPAAKPGKREGRRRTSVLIFLDKVLRAS